MDEEPPLEALKRVLDTIRERANYALTRITEFEEVKSMHWRCTGCGNTKHFTRKVPADVAVPCPKCKGATFVVG